MYQSGIFKWMRTIFREIVGAFIFSKDGQVLLGKNVPGSLYEGVWTIPGGGKEPGESVIDAVKREILEEVGIDLSSGEFKPLELKRGEGEKTINGERVLVKMTFEDFVVTLPKDANKITIVPGDDFAEAQWFKISALKDLQIAPQAKKTIAQLTVKNNIKK
jgi:8-oxo-dGTP pyrophosphatase MutT (NUDIX family)